MSAFEVLFTLAMLLFPAVFLLFYRPRPDSDVARIGKLQRSLWIWTAVAVLAYLGLWLARDTALGRWWIEQPKWMHFGKYPDELAWMMFFPLWFGPGMRLLLACRPEAGSAQSPNTTTRTASLRPRAHASPVKPAYWMIGWAIVVACMAIVLLRVGFAWMPFVSIGAAVLSLAISPWAVRLSLQEPEPMDARNSEELARAYARHRNAKAWGFYGLGVCMATLSGGAAVLLASGVGSGPAAGWIGGILGSLVGIAGAAFGVIMGNQRMRIRRMLDELESR